MAWRAAGDNKYTVFGTKKTISYHQAETTQADFVGGLGGFDQGDTRNEDVPPGRIDNAKLKLDFGQQLSGVLTFDVKLGEEIRSFTIPVVSDMELRRLFAAVAGAPVNVQCKDRPGRIASKAPEECPLSKAPFPEVYDGYGAFFGDHAALAAFHYHVTLNVPSRNRTGVRSTGVIILKAEP